METMVVAMETKGNIVMFKIDIISKNLIFLAKISLKMSVHLI